MALFTSRSCNFSPLYARFSKLRANQDKKYKFDYHIENKQQINDPIDNVSETFNKVEHNSCD